MTKYLVISKALYRHFKPLFWLVPVSDMYVWLLGRYGKYGKMGITEPYSIVYKIVFSFNKFLTVFIWIVCLGSCMFALSINN